MGTLFLSSKQNGLVSSAAFWSPTHWLHVIDAPENLHQTFPGEPDHYSVHILEVYVYRLVPMRGPTIKRPSGPRQDHRQHLRLANYTSFTPQWESHWVMAWQRCICSHLLHVDKMNQVVDTQEHFVPLKACQQMSSLCLFASLLEHCQCFPCEDVCLIFTL